MKNSLKKCLLVALFFPLTACAHYYQGPSGYYPNSGGYGGWQRNYYGYAPSHNFNYYGGRNGYYPNYRQPNFPSFPHRDHDGWRQEPQHRPMERDNHYGFNQGNHDGGDRNSWQQHQSQPPNYPQQQGGRGESHERWDHQGRRDNGQGQYNHYGRGHNDR